MVTFLIDSQEFKVEFRYSQLEARRKSKPLNQEASVIWPSIRGVTTCVIQVERFVCIENVFCAAGDPFSKAVGRRLAFMRLVHTGPSFLRRHSSILAQAFDKRFPIPVGPVRFKISPANLEQMAYTPMAEGIRTERATRRFFKTKPGMPQ